MFINSKMLIIMIYFIYLFLKRGDDRTKGCDRGELGERWGGEMRRTPGGIEISTRGGIWA